MFPNANRLMGAVHPRACGERSSQKLLRINPDSRFKERTEKLPALRGLSGQRLRCSHFGLRHHSNQAKAVEVDWYAPILANGIERKSGIIRCRPGDNRIAIFDVSTHLRPDHLPYPATIVTDVTRQPGPPAAIPPSGHATVVARPRRSLRALENHYTIHDARHRQTARDLESRSAGLLPALPAREDRRRPAHLR
jgi:hypothetical protein